MRFGVFASIILHIAVVAAAMIGVFPSFRSNFAPEPYIPLELIREAELDLKTSVPAAAPKPVDEEPEPAPPEPEVEDVIEEPVSEPEPVSPEPEPEPEPAPPKPDPKPEEKKEEPPVKKPEPKKDELDFDALSKLIDKEREAETKTSSTTPSETQIESDKPRNAVGAGDRLTASDEAKMRAAVERCWNASAIIGAPEPEKLVVTLNFELNRDGTLSSPPRVANAMQINLSGNRFWKVAEQSAVRAVVTCAPYDFLPQDRYDTWKEFQLNFDPSQMVGR